MITENVKKKQCCDEYFSYGWKLIPIRGRTKIPMIEEWTTKYLRSSEEMANFIDKYDNLNMGVVCGKPSGIVVIDIDLEKDENGELTGYDGITSIRQKEAELRAKLPDTVISQTQGGGLQMWFKYPNGIEKITSTVNKLRSVDIRGDGSQVVVFPSVGAKGKYYWLNSPSTTKIAELPKEWIRFLTQENETTQGNIIKLAIRDNFSLPMTIPQSMRNDTLFKYCCSMLSKGEDIENVKSNLLRVNNENCIPPLSIRELDTIINSAAKMNAKNNAKKEEIITQLIVGDNKPASVNSVDEVVVSSENPSSYDWLNISDNGRVSINEAVFARWFMKEYKLYYVHEKFYDEYGEASDRKVKQIIQHTIENFITTQLDTKVNNLLNALKNISYYEPPTPMSDVINFDNVSVRIKGNKIEEVDKPFTFNKLRIMYKPYETNKEWEQYIGDLLYEEDIPLLQEYLGYCLLPTTRGQKAMFVIGQGGEGKSGIVYMVQRLLGNSCVTGEFHQLEENDFLISNLENKLLFVDDDLQLGALNNTGRFKTLVTMQGNFTVNRKGVQQYEISPYTRFLCLGNGVIKAKYDKTEGFYSRLLVIKVKPIKRRGSDIEDNQLYSKMASNLSGFANWCIEGLQRLIRNNYHFTESARSKNIVDGLKEECNNIVGFLQDVEYVKITNDNKDYATSKELLDTYHLWCIENEITPMADRTFSSYIKDNAEYLGIEETRSIKRNDKYMRGYTGVCVTRLGVKKGEKK